jgi:GNAT superfamily N-acetyltransferase
MSAEEISELTDLINRANAGKTRIFPGERLGPNSLLAEYSGCRTLILRQNEQPVGTVTTRKEEEGLMVLLLAVDPSATGQALGSILINHAESLAQEMGLSELRLDAVDHGRLVPYYLGEGFREDSRMLLPEGHWGALVPFHLVRMCREIPKADS